MTDVLKFTVLGRPEPQGSMKAFMIAGRPRLTSDNRKMKPWRQEVGQTALMERPSANVWAGRHEPVSIMVEFFFARPKSAKKGRTVPACRPDLDKLLRSLNDSLTGILYQDDGQVVEMTARKHYGLPERAEIEITKL